MLNGIVWTKWKNIIKTRINISSCFYLSDAIPQNTIIFRKCASDDNCPIIVNSNGFNSTISSISCSGTYKILFERTCRYSSRIINTSNFCKTILSDIIKFSKSTANKYAVVRRISSRKNSNSINDIICSICCRIDTNQRCI